MQNGDECSVEPSDIGESFNELSLEVSADRHRRGLAEPWGFRIIDPNATEVDEKEDLPSWRDPDLIHHELHESGFVDSRALRYMINTGAAPADSSRSDELVPMSYAEAVKVSDEMSVELDVGATVLDLDDFDGSRDQDDLDEFLDHEDEECSSAEENDVIADGASVYRVPSYGWRSFK